MARSGSAVCSLFDEQSGKGTEDQGLDAAAIPSLYFDWFGGCIQAFIFCTLTTLFIKQAAGDD